MHNLAVTTLYGSSSKGSIWRYFLRSNALVYVGSCFFSVVCASLAAKNLAEVIQPKIGRKGYTPIPTRAAVVSRVQ